MLPKNQHGFISGRSTLSQLLHQVEQMIREWEDGKATDTIYLDFAKAFDKVDHNILCHKLKKTWDNWKSRDMDKRISHWKSPTSCSKWSTF